MTYHCFLARSSSGMSPGRGASRDRRAASRASLRASDAVLEVVVSSAMSDHLVHERVEDAVEHEDVDADDDRDAEDQRGQASDGLTGRPGDLLQLGPALDQVSADAGQHDRYVLPATAWGCRRARGWQGRQDSNLQPLVLETSALPIELHPSEAAPSHWAAYFVSRCS